MKSKTSHQASLQPYMRRDFDWSHIKKNKPGKELDKDFMLRQGFKVD